MSKDFENNFIRIGAIIFTVLLVTAIVGSIYKRMQYNAHQRTIPFEERLQTAKKEASVPPQETRIEKARLKGQKDGQTADIQDYQEQILNDIKNKRAIYVFLYPRVSRSTPENLAYWQAYIQELQKRMPEVRISEKLEGYSVHPRVKVTVP